MSNYIANVQQLLGQVADTNSEAIRVVAGKIAKSLADDGVLHVFGSGHSNLLAQEMFHRAGGLAPVNAMLDVNLTIFGTSRPTWVERLEGYAESIFTSYEVRPGEVQLIFSNSGINPVPIEMAMIAKDRGLIPVAVGSAAVYADAESRHSSCKSLFDIAEYTLDTCVPYGDTSVEVRGRNTGPVSTLLGSAVVNLLAIEVIDQMGEKAPVFVSQNIPGGDEANKALIDRYRGRIPLMKP